MNRKQNIVQRMNQVHLIWQGIQLDLFIEALKLTMYFRVLIRLQKANHLISENQYHLYELIRFIYGKYTQTRQETMHARLSYLSFSLSFSLTKALIAVSHMYTLYVYRVKRLLLQPSIDYSQLSCLVRPFILLDSIVFIKSCNVDPDDCNNEKKKSTTAKLSTATFRFELQ